MTFHVSQRVDENGIVLVTLTGTWDSHAWAEQIEENWRTMPDGFDPEGRPILTDMIACELPESDWVEHFKLVAIKLSTRRKQPFRRAVLIRDRKGGENELAVRLMDAAHQAWHNPQIETRAFTARDAAYAWLTELWLGQPRDDQPGVESG